MADRENLIDTDTQKGVQNQTQVAPLTDLNQQLITDGEEPIASDTQGILSGEFEQPAIEGVPIITFEEGNFESLDKLQSQISSKKTILTQQFIPLIHVAIIELLGSTNGFKPKSANIGYSLTNNDFQINFVLVYSVPLWIGTDVEESDIYEDAKYILDKISLSKNVKISKCQVDTSEGILTVAGNI